MFVVALAPFKSLCYFFKIYFAADTAKSKPEADLLDLISRNRDIVYLACLATTGTQLTSAAAAFISFTIKTFVFVS